MLKKNQILDTFNDGVLTICSKKDKRVKQDVIKDIRFGNETLGYNRYYGAKVANTTITRLVRIPFNNVINNDDREKYVVLLDGQWFDIDLIQIKFDTSIPKIVFTLKKGGPGYIDER